VHSPTVATPRTGSSFPPGGALLLYTDGLVERPGETLDEGTERLAVAFAGARTKSDAEAAIDHVLKTCLDDQPRWDDVCILDVRRPGAARM
jgi:serine phosphatase RsbU (regulator of sigma subunit)